MSGRILVAAAVLAIASGCGAARQSAWEAPAPAATTAPATATAGGEAAAPTDLVAEGEAAWAQRDDEAQLRLAIAKWTEASAADPGNHEIHSKLARAHYFLADGHLRFDPAKVEEMMTTYETASQSAERALMLISPEFGERMRAGARMEEAVSLLPAEAVPALYWRSSALGKWASQHGFTTLLEYKDEIRAVMTHVLELNPTYFHGGPHRYFGAFFARAPSFAGGDTARSQQHFEESLRIEPNCFSTRVLYAFDYAKKTQNRALFEEQLNLVINGDPDLLPAMAPENRAEQRKAAEFLAQADEWFE